MVRIAKGLNKDLQFFLGPAQERTDVEFSSKAQRRRIDPRDVKFSIELLTEGLSAQKVSALLVREPPRKTKPFATPRGGVPVLHARYSGI
jgi:hypothetical protein